jgi:hypothetical protein
MVLAALALVAGLAACGSSAKPATAPTSTRPPSTTGTTSTTASTSSTTGTAPATSSTTAGGTPVCASDGLTVTGSVTDPGAGSYSEVLTFVNKGTSACTLSGYPGVSAVGAGGGQIGPAAVRTGQPTGTVTVRPGQAASAVLRVAQAGDFPASACQPQPATGFRVYPPGQTAPVFVGATLQACAGSAVQFHINAIVAGIAAG